MISHIIRRFKYTTCSFKFVDTADLCSEELHQLLWICLDLKQRQKSHKSLGHTLRHRRITMLTQRQGLCINFIAQAAAKSLGLDLRMMQSANWGQSKFKGDIGRFHALLSDMILAQSQTHQCVCELTEGAAPVPVVNVISHKFAPLHGLGVLMTLQEHFGHLAGLTMAWVGPMGNHLNTLLYLLPKAGINLRYNCSPTPEQPKSPIVKPRSLSYCKTFHTTVKEFCSPEETIKGADVIATSKHREETVKVELSMTEGAKEGWVFLHLLPRWRGDVSEEVFTHSNSLVWPLHENIYFATMAVILSELEDYQPITPRPDFGSH